MKQPPVWTIVVMVVGLAGALLGPVVAAWLIPPTAVWSEEDAAAWSQAGAELHAAIHTHGKEDHQAHGDHAHGETTNVSLESARANYDRQQAKRESSESRRSWLLIGVRALGIVLAIAGVAGLIANRQSV
jgi:opacity protein-like surface antigen